MTQKKNNLVQSPIQQEYFNESRNQFLNLINKHFAQHYKFYNVQ